MAGLVAFVLHKWAEPKGSTGQCKDSEGATGRTKGRKLLYGNLCLNDVYSEKEGL